MTSDDRVENPSRSSDRTTTEQLLDRIRKWAQDESMSESGKGDGPETDTYEIGYGSAQGTVEAILNGWNPYE